MPLWIGSPTDIHTGESAAFKLAAVNDAKYAGKPEIDAERWEAAQAYELATWRNCDQDQDRNKDHERNFCGYADLPADLGAALEVGCGPFTQLATILQSGHTAGHVSLLDPLAEQYVLEHVRYKQVITVTSKPPATIE